MSSSNAVTRSFGYPAMFSRAGEFINFFQSRFASFINVRAGYEKKLSIHYSVATAIAILFFTWSHSAFSFDVDCTINGIAEECAAPIPGPWWCSGPATDVGSSPECDANHKNCDIDDEIRILLAGKEAVYHHACTYSSSWTGTGYLQTRYTLGLLDNHARQFIVPMTVPDGHGSCVNLLGIGGTAQCTREIRCPDGYFSPDGAHCVRSPGTSLPLDPPKNLGMCSAPTGGNACTPHPINIGTGNKFLSEVDIPATAGGLEFRRFYNSQDGGLSSGLSVAWRHNYSSRVEVSTATGDLFAAVAVVSRPDGRVVRFVQTTGNQNWVSDSDVTEQLSSISSGGAASGYQLIDAATDRVESYDLSGVLISVDDRRSGRTFALAYDENNRLSTVTDRSGRQLLLAYDATGRITDVWEPDSVAGDPSSPHWTYSYDISLNRLSSVTGPDQSSRVYAYENSSFVYALTGITDENGNRYATYAYDAQGRASGENLWAGNSQTAPVSQYTLSYQSGNLVHVTDPLSHSHDYQFNVVQGMAVLAALSEPCMLCGGSGSTKSRTYDPTTGFTDLVIDFDGTVTDYDYNSRGLEAQRIEAKTTTGSSAPAEKRTTQTDWHATFRVPTQRRVYNASNTLEAQTSWAYNSRGQATARCEADPSVSGATTYTCGSLATAPAGVRQWLTTYCEQSEVTGGTCPLVGLTKSTNGPRATTDAGMASLDDTTTYTYYQTDDSTCASGGACPHRHGDLWKVTNALSQVTTYVNYDKNGRVTRMQDANGTYTDFVYHPRGWLTDRIVRASAAGSAGAGDATTHIDYDAVGNVTKVTQPDSAYLAYTYDDAHRLIKIADNQNNTIDYCPDGVGGTNCLDAAGNRKVEQVKDPSGVLKRSLSRTYNTLSQLTQVLNHASQPVEHSNGLSDTGVADGYDGNGNRVLVQDGLNTTTKQTYDGLNRLVATIQNYNGTDTVTANTTTGYTYDTRDNLRQVTDPDGLNTVYTYDGLNNLTGLSSPDTGNSTYTYDKAGNRITQTDNRSPSVTSTYTYDALNRLTAIAYPTTTLNVTYAYDQANATTGCTTSYPIGRLTTMTDGSGSTTYCYDRRGNVTQKKQVTSGVTLTTQYSYTLADRLASLTYPSGAIVTYSRDSVGRITTVTWKANATATATTLVSNATYYPFGPLNVLTFGNGRTLTKTYDQDYAIDSVASSASTGLKLDLGVDVMGDIVQASGTIAPTTPDRQYGYDPLYRLTTAQTGAATPSPLEGYTYGKTGDRLGVSLNGATPTTYTYTAGSHRLASVGGTARTYDGNGNTQTGVTTGFTFTYDDKNRLSKAQQSHAVNISYVTNGRGERVNKNGTTTTGTMSTLVAVSYSYNEGGQLLGDYAATTGVAQTEYVYLDGVPIAVVKGMSLAYVETDHLGTPRQVVDPATNTALWTWDLLASTYGTNAPNQSPTGGAAYMLNLRFPGQYFDAEMGLNYNYFRDYEPTTGRYAESDPIGLFGGSSTYGYARNRSINFVDRKGLIAGALPLPWIWEIPPWAKNPVGLCLFAVTYSTPLSSNDEITPAVPQPGTCPNTQPPANDSQCRTSDYCRQMHDMLEAWRLGLISELSELLGDTQGALGADPGWAALHQWIIQDIRNFNEAVDKYNAICDPKIDRFANRPIP